MKGIFALLASTEESNPLQKVYEVIAQYFDTIVEFLVLLVEIVGICVLIVSVVTAIIRLFQHNPHVRLHLAEGIALSLEFKLGGELLRTVIVHEWNELLILGAVIVLRAALTFLIQWEIKLERRVGNITDAQVRQLKNPLIKRAKNKQSENPENN